MDVSYSMDMRYDIINRCSQLSKQTYIVMGNEDYYNGPDVSETLDHYISDVAVNVTYLNNVSILIGKEEFFCTTLWKPYDPWDISNMICDRRDFEEIYCHGNLIDMKKIDELHCICAQWLCSAILNSKAERKIIVSHHEMPSDMKVYLQSVLNVDMFFNSTSSNTYMQL